MGFGGHREWLAALAIALRRGRPRRPRVAARRGGDADRRAATRAATPTGDLHRAPRPPVRTGRTRGDGRHGRAVDPAARRSAWSLPKAAAAGALPVVARHSGLAEVAEALESEVRRPGLFSFAPGEGAIGRLATSIERILSLPAPERGELRAGVHALRRARVDVGADRREDPGRLVSAPTPPPAAPARRRARSRAVPSRSDAAAPRRRAPARTGTRCTARARRSRAAPPGSRTSGRRPR